MFRVCFHNKHHFSCYGMNSENFLQSFMGKFQNLFIYVNLFFIAWAQCENDAIKAVHNVKVMSKSFLMMPKFIRGCFTLSVKAHINFGAYACLSLDGCLKWNACVGGASMKLFSEVFFTPTIYSNSSTRILEMSAVFWFMEGKFLPSS